MTIRERMQRMTLREKAGQTGMPAPNAVRSGVEKYGSYAEYFRAVPFNGLYVAPNMPDEKGGAVGKAARFAEIMEGASAAQSIPLFVSCDGEFGGKGIFEEFHSIPTLMAVGAAQDEELAYKRGYYWAKELRAAGINWPFGPVCDMVSHFLSTSILRKCSDDPELVAKICAATIQGIQAAGVPACGKHFPGCGRDYRDSHFASCVNEISFEEWSANEGFVWRAMTEAGMKSVMTAHPAIPCLDGSFARGRVPRPASASKKVLDYLYGDIGFSGLTLTDAVSMKSLAAAFEHDDIYIECFNAGNDIVLFVHDDYIDVIERAVLDGRITQERLDHSVEKILRFKEEIGLFDPDWRFSEPFSATERAAMEDCNLQIARKALTLVANEDKRLPFRDVKHVSIVSIAQHDPFFESIGALKSAFEQRGITVELTDCIESKTKLKEMSLRSDLIIYGCYLNHAQPQGLPSYSSPRETGTMFNCMSYGAEKTVVVSFGVPSIFYNYFESADIFINAYSDDIGTMQAVAAAVLGEIPLVGKPPMSLRP